MDNEGKILEMLTAMQGNMAQMQSEIADIRDEITGIRGEMADMRETLTKVAVTQEGVVLPRLQLLYEGQVHLQQTLAPKERVEVLEDEVLTLKTSVKMISNRLAKLEKA